MTVLQGRLVCLHAKGVTAYTVGLSACTYNRLPKDEPSGSKHVEDI